MKIRLTALFILCSYFLFSQQLPDSAYHYPIDQPRYSAQKGPVVMIDEGHNNFHTMNGRYRAFANILEDDGYRLHANEGPITEQVLEDCKIYVIANPLHESNIRNWRLPNPSAFTPAEIEVLKNWVEEGGRLFLIADHMPFAGAAEELAASFGFIYLNSFARDEQKRRFEYFTRADGNLHDCAITNGTDPEEAVDSVVTFTGSAFQIPKGAQPVISLTDQYTILMPEVAWQFDEKTRSVNGKGYFQLASMQVGKGKIVVSGEAAMFSGQLAGPDQYRMGLNNPAARANNQFLLNLVHWLDQP